MTRTRSLSSTVALVSGHASPLASLGTPDAGGQNVYVGSLASALAARGHTVTVYTRRDDRLLPERVRVAGYDVVHVPAGPPEIIDKDRLFPFMDEFAARLQRLLNQSRPDVVHSHFWMSGYAAFAAAGALHIPVVHTFHALGTVKRRHQGEADGSPPERLGLEHQLLRHVDRVVATCEDEAYELDAMARSLAAASGTCTSVAEPARTAEPAEPIEQIAERMRISIVPCGFDSSVFRPEGQRLPRNGRHLLAAVSRLVPRTGLDDVLSALTQLPDTELVIAGGPPADALHLDPHHERLLSVADDLGVSDRVRFVGGVSPSAVAAIDRTADVFVAAPHYEPFGIAPVEAMACATPVVGTSVGGLLDTVIDGGTGMLVPPADPDALASAIAGLLADPVRRAALGDRAAWRARRRYTWAVVARAMEHVYDDVVDGANSVRVQTIGSTRSGGRR